MGLVHGSVSEISVQTAAKKHCSERIVIPVRIYLAMLDEGTKMGWFAKR